MILVKSNNNYIDFTPCNLFKSIFYDIYFILRKIFLPKNVKERKGAPVENCERLCYIQKKIGPVDASFRYSTGSL